MRRADGTIEKALVLSRTKCRKPGCRGGRGSWEKEEHGLPGKVVGAGLLTAALLPLQ